MNKDMDREKLKQIINDATKALNEMDNNKPDFEYDTIYEVNRTYSRNYEEKNHLRKKVKRFTIKITK